MSWLIAVAFPGLLMIVTVGLQRLESLLHGERHGATEILVRLAQPVLSESVLPLPASRFDPMLMVDEPGLPTRPNPLFQPSATANRV